jgi:hypothetical protein
MAPASLTLSEYRTVEWGECVVCILGGWGSVARDRNPVWRGRHTLSSCWQASLTLVPGWHGSSDRPGWKGLGPRPLDSLRSGYGVLMASERRVVTELMFLGSGESQSA